MAYSSYKSVHNDYDNHRHKIAEMEQQMKAQRDAISNLMMQQIDMMDKASHPMYLSGSDVPTQAPPTKVTYDPKTASYHVERQLHMSREEFDKYVGMDTKKDVPTAPPVRQYLPYCDSCSGPMHSNGQRYVTKGTPCDVTIKRDKIKSATNIRKVYWYRRAKRPELFETK